MNLVSSNKSKYRTTFIINMKKKSLSMFKCKRYLNNLSLSKKHVSVICEKTCQNDTRSVLIKFGETKNSYYLSV